MQEQIMKRILQLLLAFSLIISGAAAPVLAGATDPLYVNMTTSDSHRANMAISFSKNQFERGHPLTIFLNDKGVLVGSKANAAAFPEHQKMLAELMSKGAVVLICPMCMKQYGVKEADILPGVKVSSPELTGNALFQDNTKTLTW
jgi:sulfur relay (sulfurtransferase) complex TusBCD TusD component (DsrE family)